MGCGGRKCAWKGRTVEVKSKVRSRKEEVRSGQAGVAFGLWVEGGMVADQGLGRRRHGDRPAKLGWGLCDGGWAVWRFAGRAGGTSGAGRDDGRGKGTRRMRTRNLRRGWKPHLPGGGAGRRMRGVAWAGEGNLAARARAPLSQRGRAFSQWLENGARIFPMVGKQGVDFSNGWKNGRRHGGAAKRGTGGRKLRMRKAEGHWEAPHFYKSGGRREAVGGQTVSFPCFKELLLRCIFPRPPNISCRRIPGTTLGVWHPSDP